MEGFNHHSNHDLKALILSQDAIFRGTLEDVLKSSWLSSSALVECTDWAELGDGDSDYDIALVDVDSLELTLEELKCTFANQWHHTYVIALANSVDGIGALRWLELGARGYIEKTDDKERLRTLVGAVSQGEVVISKSAADGIFGASEGEGILLLGGLHGVDKLTPTETQVLHSLCKGMTNQDIAMVLGCSIGTVKAHLKNLFAIYEVGSRLELVVKAATLDRLSHIGKEITS